jgi:hypothetical protein
MPQISYTISGSTSQGGASVSITGGDSSNNRCQTNCSGKGNGNHVSNFNGSDLTKGVTYTMNLVISEGACSDSSIQTICCPATGGSILGGVTPVQNTQQTFTISGIEGNYVIVGQNNGWSIVGGNASIVSSTNNDVSVNVGTQPFSICYNINSCGTRNICVPISPQAATCTLSVGTVTITC